jgi:hypothetical protein
MTVELVVAVARDGVGETVAGAIDVSRQRQRRGFSTGSLQVKGGALHGDAALSASSLVGG